LKSSLWLFAEACCPTLARRDVHACGYTSSCNTVCIVPCAQVLCTPMHAAKDAESQSVAVLYEHRAAPQGLERMKVIDEVISHVPRPPHTVKLKGASKTISVQVHPALPLRGYVSLHSCFRTHVVGPTKGGQTRCLETPETSRISSIRDYASMLRMKLFVFARCCSCLPSWAR
jgi:hypothetical protein